MPDTVKKIRSSDLRVGMYISKVHSSWLNSPLIMSNFTVSAQSEIDHILDYGIDYVSIDTARGLDVEICAPAPQEPELTLARTFEIPLSSFLLNHPAPVDFYVARGEELEQVFRRGLALGDEALELLEGRGIGAVRVPEAQRADYDAYLHKAEQDRERRRGEGFEGEYLDPEATRRHLSIMQNFHPIDAHTLIPGSRLPFDLFRRAGLMVTIILQKGDMVSEAVCVQWVEQGITILIRKEARGSYRAYLVAHARKASDPVMRVAFVRENSKIIVESLAENPRSEGLFLQARESVNDLTQVVLENPASFHNLIKLNEYDYYTFSHSVNVAAFSLAMAMAVGVTEKEGLAELGFGALLHDVGKAKVDHAILNKPGRLTDSEFDIMRGHVTLGVELLREGPPVAELSYHAISQHHEKLSGTGYPNRLRGGQIHLFGRIAGIMDMYDALTTRRAYRQAFRPFDALVLMFKSQEDYDVALLTQLVKMLGTQKLAR